MNFERGMMGPRRSGDLWVRGPSTFTRDFTAYSVMMMQGKFFGDFDSLTLFEDYSVLRTNSKRTYRHENLH